MEIVLLFLLKTISSGIVGHYLKKILQKVDAHFLTLLESGESIQLIEAYVKEAGIEEKITAIAAKTIDESIVVPIGGPELPTVDDKCQLFTDIIKLGYELAVKLKVDLLLPGSFVSPRTFSLFLVSGDAAPDFSVRELTIYLPKDQFQAFFVFPQPKKLFSKNNTWQLYKEAIRNARQNVKAHLSVARYFEFLKPLMEKYTVETVTPGKLEYKYASIMPTDKQKAIGAKNGQVDLMEWADGVALMINSLYEIRDLQILDPVELGEIVRLQSRLRDFSDLA